jgi:hypothetical protein
MATAIRQRSRSSLIKPETVGHVIAFLEELPEKPKKDLSLKAAVEQMQQSIKETLSKGYSYGDVSKILSEKGITISALTLKNYVPSGRRQATKTKAKRPKKSSGEASTVTMDTANGSVASATLVPVAEPSAEPAPTKPRRGRAKVAAKPTAEVETKPKPTRGRKPTAAKPETSTSTARKRRPSKTTAS